ncbi:MAG TPA: rhodanese-like domain-containing protein [Flavobacteriales bacterium]|nr:rhodanese-like domain-containing protein [Flavobacteriales bacterium]
MSIKERINHEETTIVDVRTQAEFLGGHIKESINIPLHQIASRLDELMTMQPLVLCCASGGRSGQATAYLKGQGLDVVNGGGWIMVDTQKV